MRNGMSHILSAAKSALVVITLVQPILAQEPPNLELKLLCDKRAYLLEEPIWIDILLINHEEGTVMVNFPTPKYDHFHFIVVEQGNDTVPYSGVQWEFGGHAGMNPDYRLAAGDTVYYTYNLIEVHGISPKSTRDHAIPLSGNVEITGVFWDCYYSNTLCITISEPSEAEADVYELFRQAMKGRMGERAFEQFHEILDLYPNSVYAANACYELAAYYDIHFHNPEKDREYSLRVLTDYPNSGYAAWSIQFYVGDAEGESRTEKLDSLRTADKPFRLRMIARNYQRGLFY